MQGGAYVGGRSGAMPGGAGIGGRSSVMQGSACAGDICADTGRGTDIPVSRAMKEEAVAKLARAMLEGEEL